MIDAGVAALRHDLAAALGVSLAFVALLALAEGGRRALHLPTEWTRKGAHALSGAVVVGFPWWIDHTLTIALLAGAFLGLLLWGKRGALQSIHGVERRTSGAYYYPIAVLMVWLLAAGDRLTYTVPLGIMALADTGAALVGQHTRVLPYPVLDGHRTAGGSLTFFAIAALITVAGGLVAGLPLLTAVHVAALVATFSTAAESLSVRGLDNLAVPYFAWLLLEHTARADVATRANWTLGIALGALMVALSLRAARLTVTGAITLFAATALSWALGGAAWFLPLLGVYLLYLLTRPKVEADLNQVFPTAAGPLVVLLVSAHFPATPLYGPYLTAVVASAAMTSVVVARVRAWPLPLVALVATLTPTALGSWIRPDISWLLPLAGGLWGVVLFDLLSGTQLFGRRLLASLLAASAAWWVLSQPPG